MPDRGAVLAVVPARCGSKRLPRKNVLPLGGKPLIAWILDTALESGVFAEVLVTDDPEIAEVARGSGASVPWLRPADLGSDTARSIDVLRHAMLWYEAERGSLDGVALLQRSVESIRGAATQYGAIYIVPPEGVCVLQPLVGPQTRAFVMSDPDEAVDIDDENDWHAASVLAAWLAGSATRGGA